MSVALVNPYTSLAALKDELKIAQADTDKDDELNRAINEASRWIDQYRGRDYYGHDHRGEVAVAGEMAAAPGTSALVLDNNSDTIFGDGKLYLPWVARNIYRIVEGEETLDLAEDYVYRRAPAALEPILYRNGTWQAGFATAQQITIRGKFGYNQWTQLPGEFTGLPAFTSLLLDNDLPEKQNVIVYPKVVLTGPLATVTIYSDAAYTQAIAVSPTNYTQPAVNVALTEVNSSGYSGTFSATTMAANVQGSAQLQNDVLDPTLVPTDLPGYIGLAAKLVAAALSGHNRKEVVGLDGQKQEIHTNTIPKTVYDMLGKRGILI